MMIVDKKKVSKIDIYHWVAGARAEVYMREERRKKWREKSVIRINALLYCYTDSSFVIRRNDGMLTCTKYTTSSNKAPSICFWFLLDTIFFFFFHSEKTFFPLAQRAECEQCAQRKSYEKGIVTTTTTTRRERRRSQPKILAQRYQMTI